MSTTPMALWQPRILATYENNTTSYIDQLLGPMRLKYPNKMAGKELITSLTEVSLKRFIQGEADFKFLRRFAVKMNFLQSLRDLQRWPGWTSSPALAASVDFASELALCLSRKLSTGSPLDFAKTSRYFIWQIYGYLPVCTWNRALRFTFIMKLKQMKVPNADYVPFPLMQHLHNVWVV